jgi:hypothetical protein
MKIKSKMGVLNVLNSAACFIVVAVACFYLQSCDLIDSDVEFDYKLEIPEKFNEVGMLHNEGLDYIFEKIKDESIELVKESELFKNARTIDFHALVTEGTLEFCRNKKALNEDYLVIKEVLKNPISLLKSTGLSKEANSDLSSRQIDLITQVSTALVRTHENPKLTFLKSELDNMNKIARLELCEDEASIIFCATSTAFSSYQYWLKNYRKWYFALNYPEILEKYKEEELNKLRLMNGNISLKSGEDTNWWNLTWDKVEDWWENASDEISDWWEEDGKEIANSDVEGAVSGAMGSLIITGGTLSVLTTVSCALAASGGKAVTVLSV